MNRTGMNNLLAAIMVIITVCFVSCRHKELCDEKIFVADVKVVFDWKKSPDAHVETMRVYLFPADGGKPCYMNLPIYKEAESQYRQEITRLCASIRIRILCFIATWICMLLLRYTL